MRLLITLSFSLLLISTASRAQTVSVQLIGINDFHGNLEPPTGSSGRVEKTDAGGVEYLATHIKNLRAKNPNTLVVAAGDLIGATPLVSALFHDEPTIESMNLLGLDFSAVGNHEFDDGWQELLRMQQGGCHAQDGCKGSDVFKGASFNYLAANVVRKDTGITLFPSYKIKEVAGAKIAFIGLVLHGAPSIVRPSAIDGLDFLDEADTVNALVPELKKQGVATIVVLIHEGGFATGRYNECNGISGAIVDIVNRLSNNVDIVISGHTHQAYNCVINNKLVTSAASYGRILTDINLDIDVRSGEMIRATANNLIVTRTVAKDSEQTALIAKYKNISSPIANRVIGTIATSLTRSPSESGESSLGRVIADAQEMATAGFGFGEAVVAFMNPGGIRADLSYSSSGVDADGQVTYGESFNVQPFGNNLVTMTLTGDQIHALLEQQFEGCGQTANTILQVSKGFNYTWAKNGAPCTKVDPFTIKIDGARVDPKANYRVTVNSFLSDGGDGFTVFRAGSNRLNGMADTEALESYFKFQSPLPRDEQPRIFLGR